MLSLPGSVVVDDVTIYDQDTTAMLTARRLSAQIRIADLLHKKVNISSLQLFGLNAHLHKRDSVSQANYQFLLDALGKKENEEEGWKVRLNTIIVRRSNLAYHRLDLPQDSSVFSANHLQISDISAHLVLDNVSDEQLVHIRRLSMREQSGLRLNSLSGRIGLGKEVLAVTRDRKSVV